VTLTDFLLARITEDEAEAAESHAVSCARTNPVYEDPEQPPDDALCDCRQRRVLAECGAKRRIIAEHAPDNRQFDCRDDAGSHAYYSDEPGTYGYLGECRTLRILALPYEDHPDYREEWRP
jgi:Family of unknown function (DUF6221)